MSDKIVSDMERKKIEYLKRMEVTADDVNRIMTVEQRSDEWLNARKARLTGSIFGSALGHNKYSTPRQLLKELLWSSFEGNPATRHGTKNEPLVQKLYEKFIAKHYPNENCSVIYPGLIICKKHPWLAGSPDGLSKIGALRLLLEIKCPFYKKSYPYIPHYYYDQIQGIMGILKLDFCDFVTWSDEIFQVRRFKFDPVYWNKVMFPGLQAFYMNEYLPRLIWKEEGLLKQGEIDVKDEEVNVNVAASSSSDALQQLDFLLSMPVVPAATVKPVAKKSKKQ